MNDRVRVAKMIKSEEITNRVKSSIFWLSRSSIDCQPNTTRGKDVTSAGDTSSNFCLPAVLTDDYPECNIVNLTSASSRGVISMFSVLTYITKSFHVTEVISSSIINNWVWARIGLQECSYSWELNESIARALSSLSKFCKRDKGSGNYSSAEPKESYYQRGGIHPHRSPIHLKGCAVP